VLTNAVLALLTRLTPLALVLGVGLAGCSHMAMHEQTVTVEAPHLPATAVDIQAHNGSIQVQRGSGSGAVIIATLRMTTDDRLGGTTITATRDARQALIVRAEPPKGGWRSRESVAFRVEVPEAVGVKAATSNGKISLQGLSGPAELKTSNGGIVAEGHQGSLRATTTNGGVRVELVTGSVDIRTSNGAVTIRLERDAAGPVKVRTSNGRVTLRLGEGFGGTIDASTSNGGVSFPSDARVERKGRTSARIALGVGGGESEIATSNGSITIER
jgi:hypothetical protein